jgi:hypothetical protein
MTGNTVFSSTTSSSWKPSGRFYYRGGKAGGILRCIVGSRADFEAMNRVIALHRLRRVID